MKILAIDTSDDTLSVALNDDGDVIESSQRSRRGHNQHVLDMIERLLADAQAGLRQIDAVAFGQGPGSFTGLRIAAAVAQGMGYGLDVPVIPVSCLQAIARSQRHDKVIVALGARDGAIFLAAYAGDDRGIPVTAVPEQTVRPEDVRISGAGWHGAGSGWDAYGQVLASLLGDSLEGWDAGAAARAHDISFIGAELFRRGRTAEPAAAVPEYLSPFPAGRTD